MQRTAWWGWRYLAWILATLFILFFVVLPLVISFLFRNAESLPDGTAYYLDFAELALTYLMVAFASTWVFIVGSTFASFLNVVAWRVPRGRSILGSSHCPYCNIQLTFRDNLPIWGWLKNGGQCSNCLLPINPRYLIVEIVLGVIFLCATLTLLLSGGGILPFVDRPFERPLNSLLLSPTPFLLHILGLHLIALMAIFTFALVEQEGKQIPFSIFAVATVLHLAVVSTWPTALIVPWSFSFSDTGWPMQRMDALVSFCIGAVVGCGFGYVLSLFSGATIVDESDVTHRAQFNLGLSIVGMIAGWQGAVLTGLMLLVSYLVFRTSQTKKAISLAEIFGLPHTRVLVATLIFLASWRCLEFI